MRQRCWFAALVCFACAAAQAQGPDSEGAGFQLRGFGTLGYAQSSEAGAEFVRDVSQPNGVGPAGGFQIDSILGLQASLRSGESTEWVAQAVSHQRFDGSYTPELTWAFMRHEFNPRATLRLGRVGTEFLMQSDSRMVGYSYLPVRPTVNFYGGVPINYIDGADLQLRMPLAEGILRASLYLGVAAEKLPPYDVGDSQVRALSLGYDQGALQWRLIHAESDLAKSSTELQPLRTQLAAAGATAAARALDMSGTLSAYDSLGVAYDAGGWQVQAGLDRIRHATVLTEDSQAAHVSAARRLGNVSPYLAHAWVHSDAKSLDTGLGGPAGALLNPAVHQALVRSHQDQQTTSLGMRWDFARNLDLKLQADFVQGAADSILLYDHVQPGWSGHTTVYSLAVDYVF